MPACHQAAVVPFGVEDLTDVNVSEKLRDAADLIRCLSVGEPVGSDLRSSCAHHVGILEKVSAALDPHAAEARGDMQVHGNRQHPYGSLISCVVLADLLKNQKNLARALERCILTTAPTIL